MNGKELVTDKIKLIYEFNLNSPLFARVASSEIEKGNYLDAIRILNIGIKLFPKYPSPYFILAIAKAFEGKPEEAKEFAKIGSGIIESRETLDYYFSRIDTIAEERNLINGSVRPLFVEEKVITKEDQQEELFEDKLDLIAEQLSKAKIIPKEMIEEPELVGYSGKKIVSDTLADIFFSQKKYEEAIAMYEELMKNKPEKVEHYLQRIGEAKALME